MTPYWILDEYDAKAKLVKSQEEAAVLREALAEHENLHGRPPRRLKEPAAVPYTAPPSAENPWNATAIEDFNGGDEARAMGHIGYTSQTQANYLFIFEGENLSIVSEEGDWYKGHSIDERRLAGHRGGVTVIDKWFPKETVRVVPGGGEHATRGPATRAAPKTVPRTKYMADPLASRNWHTR